jgi:uncharacterized protein involved in exopolysaccharide biosynthesis
MDFLLGQQGRHDHEIAQIRRILLSGIRIARRDRTDFREKLNALINAQIKSEEELAAFRIETRRGIAAIQAETRQFQAETRQFEADARVAVSLLTTSVAETIDRVDDLEDSRSNGERPTK